ERWGLAADQRPILARIRRGLPFEGTLYVELEPELGGKMRKAGEVLLETRRLAQLLAQQDLAVDQVEDRLGVVFQLRPLVEVSLHRGALAPAPAPALVCEQQAQDRPVGIGPPGRGVDGRQSSGRSHHVMLSRPSSTESRWRARASFLRKASPLPPSCAAIAD